MRQTLILAITLAIAASASIGREVTILPPDIPSITNSSTSIMSPSLAVNTSLHFATDHADVLNLSDPAVQLSLVKVDSDRLGQTHVLFRQSHLGLDIRNSSLVVHLNSHGDVYRADGIITKDLPADGTPIVDISDASSIARAATFDFLNIDPSPCLIKCNLAWTSTALSGNTGHGDTRLSWLVHVSIDACDSLFCPSYGAYVDIDAWTGSILSIVPDFSGLNRLVYDCAVAPDTVACVIDHLGVDGYIHGRSEGTTPRGPHNQADMIQFGSTDVDDVYDMASAMHSFVWSHYGINGANNHGGTLAEPSDWAYSRYFVHSEGPSGAGVSFCPGGAQYLASGSIAFCLDEIYEDVFGHEYGHAILNRLHAGGVGPDGSNPQTMALVESYCDIVGESFEYDQTGQTDWLGGSGRSAPEPWRDYSNPNISLDYLGRAHAQRLYDQFVNCDITTHAGGYYLNSTVFTHAFYLAAEGGAFNGCEIEGQGIDFVNQVFHRAWLTYFAYSQGFDTAYSKIMQACGDLYPSSQCDELRKALQSVETDQEGICTDPAGSAGESAPTCAVNTAGIAITTDVMGNESDTFHAYEPIYISIQDGSPHTTVDFHLAPHDSIRPIWQSIASVSLATGPGTLNENGALTLSPFSSPQEGEYDVVIDTNRDGAYQPWSDTTLSVTVSGYVSSIWEDPTGYCVVQSVRPNPLNPQTRFVLNLNQRTQVHLAIYDHAGRIICNLIPGIDFDTGTHFITWDGTTDSGISLGSGVYFWKLSSSQGQESGKLVILK